jgi:bacillopeptidase F (M6 metalloprotease family)
VLLVGQVLRINLPNYIHKQTVFAPEGSDPYYYYYYSNQGDNLDNTMTRTLAAPLSTAKVLTFRTQYDIEEGWDYAYVEYTTNGTTWTPINGNLSTEDDPNVQNQGPAFRYFLVESRSYVRNDASLRGAYNFLFGNWLAKQPYADGVLVWLRDSGWADNNVSLHPGHGQILPIDAHPQPTISPFEPASDHAARAEQQGRPPRPHLLLQPGQRVLRLKPEGVLECADPDLEHD